MSDILKLLSIFMAIKLCQSIIDSEGYLINIPKGYCAKYCADECSVKSVKYCNQTNDEVFTDKYQLNFEDRVLNVYWLTDVMDFGTLVKLNLLSNITNVKLEELNINKEFFNELYERSQFLDAFGLNQLDSFGLIESNSRILRLMNESQTLILHDRSGSSKQSLWYDFIMHSTENYKVIYLVGSSNKFSLRENLFANQIQLAELGFNNIILENFTPAVFQNLTSLKEINFYGARVEDNSFLSSSTLQNNLEIIQLCERWLFNVKDFENFQKLKIIVLPPPYKKNPYRALESHRLRAFVCDDDNYCTFTRGVNNNTCPIDCKCFLDYITMRFVIDCAGKGLLNIPSLPIPITGIVSVYFENNNLTNLPNRSSIGYADVSELRLANNNLTKLSLNQLPPKLTLLDITENAIDTFDHEVAEFFWQRRNQMFLTQRNILWKCNCENEAFVKYLTHLRNLSETWKYGINDKYSKDSIKLFELKQPCPTNCFCCFNSTTKHFTIGCRNLFLDDFPTLPNHITGDSVILLNDNLLQKLPKLRDSELRQLHLGNNHITKLSINQLPMNITYLDIRNNSLAALDNDVITFLEKRELKLSGNPWQCSCKFQKFLTYLKENQPSEYEVALKNCSGTTYCPVNCFCCMEEVTKLYRIACDNQQLQSIPSLPNVENIKLLLSRNNLTHVDSSSEGFNNIKQFHLQFNMINEISNIPKYLEYLDVRNNSLSKLSKYVVETLLELKPTILISGNSWICHCDELPFLRLTKSLSSKIMDLCDTECSNSKMLVKIEEKDVCSNGLPIFAFVFIALMILGALLNWLQFFWKSISMWFYENNILAKITGLRRFDKDKKYDCFLAYCHKDSDLLQDFIDKLEAEPSFLRLCYYARDWLPGAPIPACICRSVEESKRIIILMTNNFLKSVWGRLEFRMALHATAKDKCKRLIVVVYPDVENFDDLDSELKTYMKLNTYLKRDDPNFWDKLITAMPNETVEGTRLQDFDNDEDNDANEVIEIELNNL